MIGQAIGLLARNPWIAVGNLLSGILGLLLAVMLQVFSRSNCHHCTLERSSGLSALATGFPNYQNLSSLRVSCLNAGFTTAVSRPMPLYSSW